MTENTKKAPRGRMELKNAVPAVPNRENQSQCLRLGEVEGLRKEGRGQVGRCPACAEANADKHRNHLIIWPDGKYGCVCFPGSQGRSHRRRIFQLIGIVDKNRHKHLPQTPLDISLL